MSMNYGKIYLIYKIKINFNYIQRTQVNNL